MLQRKGQRADKAGECAHTHTEKNNGGGGGGGITSRKKKRADEQGNGLNK